jgi:hypothetical protein
MRLTGAFQPLPVRITLKRTWQPTTPIDSNRMFVLTVRVAGHSVASMI